MFYNLLFTSFPKSCLFISTYIDLLFFMIPTNHSLPLDFSLFNFPIYGSLKFCHTESQAKASSVTFPLPEHQIPKFNCYFCTPFRNKQQKINSDCRMSNVNTTSCLLFRPVSHVVHLVGNFSPLTNEPLVTLFLIPNRCSFSFFAENSRSRSSVLWKRAERGKKHFVNSLRLLRVLERERIDDFKKSLSAIKRYSLKIILMMK